MLCDIQKYQPAHSHESFVSSQWIIKCICDQAARILYESYLESKVSSHNAEDVIMWCNGIAQQLGKQVDRGESKYELLNRWADDDEPKLIRLDNIATLSVNTQQPKQIITLRTIEDDDTKSIRSTSSKMSFMSLSKRFGKPPIVNQPQLDEVEDEQGGYRWQLVEMPDDRPPPEVDPLADRLRGERLEKNNDQMLERERKQKQKEEQQAQDMERKEKLRQQRNKQFTYDYNGDLVFLNQSNKDLNLPINQIVQLEVKTKENQLTKQNEIVPEIKTLHHEDRRQDRAIAQEFDRQPPILDALQPRQGVSILFENGHLREGGQFKKLDRLTRTDYNMMIQNQPRSKPQYILSQPDSNQNIESQAILSRKNIVMEEEREVKYKKINIENPNDYVMMLAHEASIKLPPLKIESQRQLTTQKLERINAYKREMVRELGGHTPQIKLQRTRLHAAVEKFDFECIENPSWGFVGAIKEHNLRATAYKQKRSNNVRSSPKLRFTK